jgi:hypothetical protein
MKPRWIVALVTTLAVPAVAEDKPAAPPANDSGGLGKKLKVDALTPDQQKAFLAKRTPGSLLGSFDSFASLLYAVDNVIVSTDDEVVSRVRLSSPYPEFYKPTYAELFDVIARQTKSSWHYDTKNASWAFGKPTLPLPFTIDLAKGWTAENRGNYLFCKPPGATIGMDIYVLGSYSAEPADPALAGKMRDAAALLFAQNFKKDVTVKEMKSVKVGPYEALHFETPAPKAGVTWRQWMIAEGGQTLAIVSAIDTANEKAVLPDVQTMAQTLKIIPAKP